MLWMKDILYLHFYYYLLTYSMVQSPSWEANWFAASQEIPRILWNPKVHHRTHKRPPPVPILCQSNPVHIPTSHVLEIHPNIINPSTPRFPQCSLSLRFPHQDPIRPLSSPIRATCPAHLILSPAQYCVSSTICTSRYLIVQIVIRNVLRYCLLFIYNLIIISTLSLLAYTCVQYGLI